MCLAQGGISICRGNYFDAFLSALGIVPYVGDLAKVGKVAKYARTVANAIDLAKKSAKAAEILQPLLKNASNVIDIVKNLPADQLKNLPCGPELANLIKSQLDTIQKQIDDFLEAAKRAPSIRTGKWGKGSFETAAESLEAHFAKHGAEVGAKDIDQYLRKAEAFAQNLRGATKSPVPGATPGVMRYRKNGKYIDIDPDGNIISFGT